MSICHKRQIRGKTGSIGRGFREVQLPRVCQTLIIRNRSRARRQRFSASVCAIFQNPEQMWRSLRRTSRANFARKDLRGQHRLLYSQSRIALLRFCRTKSTRTRWRVAVVATVFRSNSEISGMFRVLQVLIPRQHSRFHSVSRGGAERIVARGLQLPYLSQFG